MNGQDSQTARDIAGLRSRQLRSEQAQRSDSATLLEQIALLQKQLASVIAWAESLPPGIQYKPGNE